MNKSGEDGRSMRSPTDIDRRVGETVRKLRIQRNLTLAQLAAELGISHQQLQKYETGMNRFSAGTLSRVAEALGVSIEILFRSEGGPTKKAGGQKAAAMEDLRSEASYWLGRAQSEKKLRQMVDVLKALSSET